MEQLYQQLLDPAVYPELPCAVSFRETHISRLYLTDHYVYKLKKPLDLGFLDFSTLAKRHHFCNEEVRLNRRFSPQIYLGVVGLRLDRGRLTFGRHGRLIDYAVRMLRLPEERMLDRLIESEAPELEALMPALTAYLHEALQRTEICRQEAEPNARTVRHNCQENFAQTRAAVGTSLSAQAHQLMQILTSKELDNLEGLMLEREIKGFVRDGHGDLHTGNICLTTPPCIYDCIEFNRRFRVADVVADLAFLIMDLEFRGRRDLAMNFIRNYKELSQDPDIDILLPFYKRYRAWVRGKVSAILATEADVALSMRAEAAERSRAYFNMALGSCLKPVLFVTAGLMGVGKTTLSRALSAATGAVHLRSDVTRKQLAGIESTRTCKDPYAQGLYRKEMSQRTYDELFNKSADLLRKGDSVVVDASLAEDRQRMRFQSLAAAIGCPFLLLYLHCPEGVVLQRLEQRTGDASDGRRELLSSQKDNFDAVNGMYGVINLDARLAASLNVQEILCRVLQGCSGEGRTA